MTPTPTSWWLLEVGMYLAAADGSAWRVDGKTRSVGQDGWTLRITNRAGAQVDVSKPAETAVTLLVPTMEEAEQMFAGMVLDVRRYVMRVEEYVGHPDQKWARASLASHLLNMHGVSVSTTAHVENKSMSSLLEAHALAHASQRPMIVQHQHVPSQELM